MTTNPQAGPADDDDDFDDGLDLEYQGPEQDGEQDTDEELTPDLDEPEEGP